MDVDLILADYAQVHAGKLFVSGGGVNLLTPPGGPPFTVQLAIALTVTIPWQATNQNHTLKIALVDSDGNSVQLSDELPSGADEEDRGKVLAEFNAGRSPIMLPGEETILPVAVPLVGVPLPHPGSYQVRVEIDGTLQAAKTVRVLDPNAQPQWGRQLG